MATHKAGSRPPVGIREVARIAGVSVTASLALNGRPGVADETRRRAVAAAKQPVTALVRPEAVTLASHTSGESGPLTGTVIATTFLGATSRMTVDLGDVTIFAQLPTSDATARPAGSQVALSIRPDPVLVAADSPTASEG